MFAGFLTVTENNAEVSCIKTIISRRVTQEDFVLIHRVKNIYYELTKTGDTFFYEFCINSFKTCCITFFSIKKVIFEKGMRDDVDKKTYLTCKRSISIHQ